MSGRVCACGCGLSLAGRSARTKFFDARCKQRAHQARLNDAARAAGVPARVSLGKLKTMTSTENGQSDRARAARRRKPQPRPGVTTYFPDPGELASLIAAAEYGAAQLGGPAISASIEALRRAKARHEKRTRR